MTVVDLTREAINGFIDFKAEERRVPIVSADGKTKYTGMVWNITQDTMAGSYIDFPGHILETDDGINGLNADPAYYYRHPATVLHLDVTTPGPVTTDDLKQALGNREMRDFLIINALGKRNPHDVPNRSIYLDLDAVKWIIDNGCKLLLSDIYESQRLDGVFVKLFERGVSAVCEPVNLCKIPDEVLLTVAFPRWKTTQIPCTILAEF